MYLEHDNIDVFKAKRILVIVLLWMMIFALFIMIFSLVFLIRSNPSFEELFIQVMCYLPAIVGFASIGCWIALESE